MDVCYRISLHHIGRITYRCYYMDLWRKTRFTTPTQQGNSRAVAFTKADFHKTLQSLNWPSENREIGVQKRNEPDKETWQGILKTTEQRCFYLSSRVSFPHLLGFSSPKAETQRVFLIDLCFKSQPPREMAKLGLTASVWTFVWEGHFVVWKGLWPTKQTPWCQGVNRQSQGYIHRGKICWQGNPLSLFEVPELSQVLQGWWGIGGPQGTGGVWEVGT